MQPIHIYIVEDEPLIASTIETALTKQGYVVSGDTDNFSDALIEISNLLTLDLVLIDIQLEGDKTGIDLAKELDNLAIPYLYLTSQTDPKTITEVKQTKPLGYIIKPFTEAGLRSSIEIAWNNHIQNEPDYITFSSNNLKYKLKQSQVLYLKAFDNYCYIISRENDYLVPKTLKHVAQQLNPELFIKTHRSYIVNRIKITAMDSKSVFISEIEIPLAHSHKTEVKLLLNL